MKQRLKTQDTATLVRLSQQELNEVRRAAQELGLSANEVARRSLRVALPILRSVRAPGVAAQQDKTHDGAR